MLRSRESRKIPTHAHTLAENELTIQKCQFPPLLGIFETELKILPTPGSLDSQIVQKYGQADRKSDCVGTQYVWHLISGLIVCFDLYFDLGRIRLLFISGHSYTSIELYQTV